MFKVITGSYLMPREKRSKDRRAAREEELDEDEDEEGVGYEFVKDYKFNILHYVSFFCSPNPSLSLPLPPSSPSFLLSNV